MSKIYEFNVESLVRQQNRVLVEADSEEEAVNKVRSVAPRPFNSFF